MKLLQPEVTIYTDGACRGNPGPGGYAAVLISGGHRKELSQGYRRTTNQRMELMAVIAALETLKRPARVRLYTDSTYVRQGITEWIRQWKRRGWLTTAKKPVKNRDLWERLDQAAGPHQIDWQWVRGHAGNSENERCDALAVQAERGLSLLPDAGYEAQASGSS